MTMPNFVVIGAPASGTSSAIRYIAQHPQIYMVTSNETHFFAFEGAAQQFYDPIYGTDPTVGIDIPLTEYQKHFEDVADETAIGEKSAIYIYMPRAAERIHHHIPDAKLVAFLRQPGERAYSYYMWARRTEREPAKTFTVAIRDEERRKQENWSPRYFYREWGFYHRYLRHYYDTFRRQQIRIYTSEELKENALGVMQDLFGFLGVDAAFEPDVSFRSNVGGLPKNKLFGAIVKQVAYLPSDVKAIIPPKVRQKIRTQMLRRPEKTEADKAMIAELTQGYRGDMLALQDLIQKDLSHWMG